MTRLLLFGNCLCDRDEDVDRQKSDAVLVICSQVLEKWDHLVDDDGRRHRLDELCKVVCCLSPDHGGIIVHELAVMLPECFL